MVATHRTVNYHLSLVRAALNLESKQTPSRVGKIPYIPMVRENNTRTGFLDYEDFPTVLDALPASLKGPFVIASHSSCRKGEVLKMKWSDVDWSERFIALPDTKNGTARNLPFWGMIEKQLTAQKTYRDKHHPECEYLFFWHAEDVALGHGGVRTVPGSPLGDFEASWKNAIKDAVVVNKNVKADLLFHDLRRSGVRVMVQKAKIPEAQAMLISGHKTRSMLERYNIVSLNDVQDAGAKLDAWSKTQPKPKTPKAGKVVPIRPGKAVAVGKAGKAVAAAG